MLNNKRNILTKDEEDNVALWDITTCQKLEDFGRVPIDQKVKDLEEVVSVSNWCSVDTTIGVSNPFITNK